MTPSEKRNILKSWCLRILMAGILLTLTNILWEEPKLLLDCVRDYLAAIAVSILIYPGFAKVIRFSSLRSRLESI